MQKHEYFIVALSRASYVVIHIWMISHIYDTSFQSLRGPRGGMIFFKKDTVLGVDLETAINNAVFPGLQVSCTCFMITNLIDA